MRAVPFTSIGFLTGSIVLLGLYVAFLNQTITSGVAAHALEKELLDLNTQVSEQEFTYIALKNDIGIDYAETYGFEEIQNAHYISRNTLAPTVSSNIIR